MNYESALAKQQCNGVARGAMVRLGREARGMARHVLAKESGVATPRLRDIECDQGEVASDDELKAIAMAQGRPVSFFFWQERILRHDEMFVCTFVSADE